MAIITPLKKIFKWQQASEKIPYKVYTALLTQTGTDDPVATVLENTIGAITWERLGVGNYKGVLRGELVPGKTVCPQFPAFAFTNNASFLPISANGNPQLGWINAYYSETTPNEVFIDTYDMTGYSEWSTILGTEFLIEIRVYN